MHTAKYISKQDDRVNMDQNNPLQGPISILSYHLLGLLAQKFLLSFFIKPKS
jgi:hypothetical protein